MKKLIKGIIDWFFKFFLLFSFENFRNTNSTLFETIKTLIYSHWICCRYRFENCGFKSPVNFILGAQYFKIGNKTVFGKFVILTAWDNYKGEKFKPEVTIGEGCNFGDYLHLTCAHTIQIGNNVLTGRWVTISDNSHGNTDFENLQVSPSERKLSIKGPVIIGNNVWIGDKATILSGVSIGEGSVIGANSVITKSIPPYSVVAGNPAKIIKILRNE